MRVFNREIEQLGYNEATELISGLLVAATRDENVSFQVSSDGNIVVDSSEDGREAIEGYLFQKAKEVVSEFDNQRDIFMKVTRNITPWSKIFHRQPKVIQTLVFVIN